MQVLQWDLSGLALRSPVATDIHSLSLILTVVVRVVVVVMVVLAACMIIQISAHDFGGNTNVAGIVGIG